MIETAAAVAPPTKQREKYVREMKGRGLRVTVVDNGRANEEQ